MYCDESVDFHSEACVTVSADHESAIHTPLMWSFII